MKLFNLKGEHVVKKRKTVLHIILDNILAVFLCIVGLLFTLLFNHPLSTNVLIFIPIIMISTWNGGLNSGILATIISAVLANLSPFQGFKLNILVDALHFFGFILFIVEGTFISYIIHLLQERAKIGEYKARQRYLEKKILELEEINKQYEKEIRSRDEFLSIASHELKTPLTSMLLQTQTALHNIRNVSVAQFSFENLLKMLESVENQTKRLSKMINDLLAVSVITVGSLQLEYEDIDLAELTRGVLTDFQFRLEKNNYTITLNAEDKVIGSWDKIRIEQAISNFLSNAIKYGAGNPIEITVRKNNRFAEFIIKDNGIGVSKQKHKKIFELFQRGVSTEEYKGLGVGLYITQKIANTHGGTVEISSSPGRGSTFTMKLPLKHQFKQLNNG
jgi:signal transduction histidine kinase